MASKNHKLISDFFALEVDEKNKHKGYYCKTFDVDGEEDQLARLIAEYIVKMRCSSSEQYFESWLRKIEDKNYMHPQKYREALKVFLGGLFGDPDKNYCDTTHLEGGISEYLWFFLVEEAHHLENYIYIQPLKMDVTDKGSDGFVIHELGNGDLMFRLWEIKKDTSNAPDVSNSVGRAYRQLESRGSRYIAQMTAVLREVNDVKIQELSSHLYYHWSEATSQAAVGIAVTTSHQKVKKPCFNALGIKKFVNFTGSDQLLGLATSTEDFSQFACKVKDWVWRGL